MSNCAKCGKEIKFIKTRAGNYNPCDLPLLKFSGANEMVVSPSGQVGKLSDLGEGYISHFATCPNANDFRRFR